MSVSSSDDASDTFWPGYVDAVTNLAINLLFVIAVMAIILIGLFIYLFSLSGKVSRIEKQLKEKK